MPPKKEQVLRVRDRRIAEIVAAARLAGLIAVFEQYSHQQVGLRRTVRGEVD
jgi:hypothetical protein